MAGITPWLLFDNRFHLAVGQAGGDVRARAKVLGRAQQVAVDEGEGVAAAELSFWRECLEAL